MTLDLVRDIFHDALVTVLLVAGPALVVSLVLGLLIGFLQAITQIQEFTLTFVPKIVAVLLCLFLLSPWIARVMISFTVRLIENIPLYAR